MILLYVPKIGRKSGRPDKIISPPIVTGPGRSGRARNLNHQEDVSVFVRPLQYEKKISNDGGPPIYYADKAENPSKEIVLVSYPRDGRYRELAVYEPPQVRNCVKHYENGFLSCM